MSERTTKSKPLGAVIKIIVILAVLAVGWLGMEWLKAHGPKAVKEAPEVAIPVVRVVVADFKDRQQFVETQGRVDPLIQTKVASEVMGRVLSVSPKFKSGGRFKKNEILLEVDAADYTSALAQAESALADAELALVREEARAEQARREWGKLGRGDPSDLVLGIPQIASAKARVKASQARVAKATRDFERTKVRAPYDCLVQSIYTDLGAYVTPATPLADLYSTDAFEVRVPVTLEEFAYLKRDANGIIGEDIVLHASIAGKMRTWNARVTRNEGRVDRATMTMNLVLEVLPQEGDLVFRLPPSGLFVRVKIQGRVLPSVAEIPREALRLDHTVLVLGADDRLSILKVDVARTLEKTVLIRSGIASGARVVVSPMETPVAGMKLQILD